ncbi:DUF4129 domain-containing protein [Microbacterium sp. CIAB417]|uniref:DUF4129 domain-containing protein n=1 Tax=Microbacterium sp. CIAB417 TaxID=2860287 RepID=UPI001FABE50F|nr:DUF4129 domain-containing protein [Microbacterium sp. CIAB417]
MRRVFGIGAVAALLLVVMIAASAQGTARFDPPDIDAWTAPRPGPEAMPTQEATPLPVDPQTGGTAAQVVSTILLVLGAVVLGIVLVFLVRAILRAWAERLPRRDGVPAGAEEHVAETAPDPERTAPAIRRGIASALQEIDAHPDPADAIVAAWIGLEDTASDAGMSRGRSETPSEFTLRVIASRVDVAGDADALLHLYERVRFAGHRAGEDDRMRARQALANIQEGWR